MHNFKHRLYTYVNTTETLYDDEVQINFPTETVSYTGYWQCTAEHDDMPVLYIYCELCKVTQPTLLH